MFDNIMNVSPLLHTNIDVDGEPVGLPLSLSLSLSLWAGGTDLLKVKYV